MKVVKADLADPGHQRDVVAMTAAYALEPMGNGGPLQPEVLERLVAGLRAHPTTLVWLAYIDDTVAGIATCFVGFSTFTARPLINIHDLAVLAEYRGRGVGRALIEAIEAEARRRDCSRVTLEVREDNPRARRLYEAAGFGKENASEEAARTLFYIKPL